MYVREEGYFHVSRSIPWVKYFQVGIASAAPKVGAARYIQICSKWPETKAALQNMVAAAKQARTQLSV